ncbi:hypothetical protein FTUN_6334 [Frigoriglobus tundricola]|uniref:Uncharacterized protein n=1 Tax=Frigoriglobus tundricola TaxID=2774151 RepID=A0A6M5YXK5_9BACT|nr:hypothetical protein FTUN_6334 [Frigoriglobus tundricola]
MQAHRLESLCHKHRKQTAPTGSSPRFKKVTDAELKELIAPGPSEVDGG